LPTVIKKTSRWKGGGLEDLKLADELAKELLRSGHYEAAEQLMIDVIAWRERRYGAGHPDSQDTKGNLGAALMQTGKYEEAEKYLCGVHVESESLFGAEHEKTLVTLGMIGTLLRKQGRAVEAISVLRQTACGLTKISPGGRQTQNALIAWVNLANALFGNGEHEEAIKTSRDTLERALKSDGDEMIALTIIVNLSYYLSKKGNPEEAISLLEQAAIRCEKLLGKEHPHTLNCLNNLGDFLRDRGDPGDLERAEKILKEAKDLRERKLGPGHPETLESIHSMALLHGKNGDRDAALGLMRRAVKGRWKALGKDHPDTKESLKEFLASGGVLETINE